MKTVEAQQKARAEIQSFDRQSNWLIKVVLESIFEKDNLFFGQIELTADTESENLTKLKSSLAKQQSQLESQATELRATREQFEAEQMSARGSQNQALLPRHFRLDGFRFSPCKQSPDLEYVLRQQICF